MSETFDQPKRQDHGSWDKAVFDQMREQVSHRTLLLVAYTSLQMSIMDRRAGAIDWYELDRRSSVLAELLPREMARVQRLTAVTPPVQPRPGVR